MRGFQTIRALDYTIGIPLGLLAFYALSLTSALWTASLDQNNYIWALLLTAAIACAVGIIVTLRSGAAVVTAGTMLMIMLIGFILGSNRHVWVPPLPLDVPLLVFHGARTPLVTCAMVLVGTVGIVRLITESHRRSSKLHAAEDEPVSG